MIYYTTIAQINQGKNEFSTIYCAAFEPCNIAVYWHSKKLYLARCVINIGYHTGSSVRLDIFTSLYDKINQKYYTTK